MGFNFSHLTLGAADLIYRLSLVFNVIMIYSSEPRGVKMNSTMRWWSKCISGAINRSASRSIVYNPGKMTEMMMFAHTPTMMLFEP